MGYLDNTGLAYLWGKIKAKLVQPDWNQNDATAADYVKNRPGGYVDGAEWSDVFNRTVTFTNSNSQWIGVVSVSYELFDVGKTYKVTWDNVEYDCVCGTINTVKYLGNLALVGQTPDTGEPFMVALSAEQQAIATSQTGSQHSVIIKAFIDKIIPIDLKCLPVASDDNYGMVTTKQVSKVYNLPESVPMDDLKEAIDAFKNNGATVIWDGARVVSGYHNSQNYDIGVAFTDWPFVLYHFNTESIAADISTPDDKVYLGFDAMSIKFFFGPNSSGEYDARDLSLTDKDTLRTDATKMILNTGEVLTAGVQTLTDAQKQQARENIGAGTSSFDGDYNSLSNTPTTTTTEATLLASGWTGDSAPYSYTLSVTGVTADSHQELLPALDITAEQLAALQAANIQDGGQAAGTVTLKAFGTKPTIDLPIRIILRGD
jgi:hypothetical protein